ncbi:MAG: dTMP kinase [Planctomycetota bacterium]|jgi:dTMP kinase|nr:dTMP kinase [Planctomycetota bacterium]
MVKRGTGFFVVFEGLDGSGTTTQSRRLRDHLRRLGGEAVVTAEPSPGPTGSLIRLMLGKRVVSASGGEEAKSMESSALALLFAADRIDHLQHVVLPRLEDGVDVISDRYVLSSLAYQMEKDRSNFQWLREVNRRARRPDMTLFLRVPVSVCETRRNLDRRHRDLFEEPEILERVSSHYEFCMEALKSEGERLEIIDGTGSVDDVFDEILTRLTPLFVEHGRSL